MPLDIREPAPMPESQSDQTSCNPPNYLSVRWRKRRDAVLPCLVAFAACALSMAGCQQTERTADTSPLRVEPPVTSVVAPEQQSQSFRAAFAQGLEYTRNREHGLALGAYEAALKANPNSRDALFNLGATHEALGDPFQAITIYKRVLELEPNDADCYRNLGTCAMKLAYRERNGAWLDLARSAWQRSLELQPNQPDVTGYLAAIGPEANP